MTQKQASTQTPAEKYEEFFVPAIFGPWARVLVDRAALEPGQAVLDLACGTGIVARTAAPLVGGSARIVALDLRPGMLAAASSLPAPKGATIEWVEGDAVAPDLPDASFDHIICQAGLQFFPDRPRALSEASRMLKDGGRLTVLVWRSLDRHPLYNAMAEVEFGHLAPLGVTMDELNTAFSLGSVDELRSLLDEAGFREIEILEESRELRFPGPPEQFIFNMEYAYAAVIPEFAADPTAFASFVRMVTEETRDIVERFREGDWIVFPMHANIATARR